MPTIPWDQVKDVMDAVLELPPEARAAYLEKACPELAVRRYVESLILSYEQANEFLEAPAVATYSAAEAGSDSWVGRRVGPYQIEEEIGHGGMGSVYRALRADDQYRKQVAIKLVRSGVDPRLALSRFKAERQILADLDHPNIARLLEGGSTDDGQPYFVMEYIEGEAFDKYCDDHKLTITHRLELFRTVCSAVQYAHQKLVIHRDIKPSNIMVTKEGVPKLLDFGIAKIFGPDTGPAANQTVTMVRMLTPEYASPEQWRGEAITTSSDVYSLGVVLYELLTGHKPYRESGRDLDEIRRDVMETEAERPSAAIFRRALAADEAEKASASSESVSATREGTPEKLRRRLAGDLDNIVLMAIRKEPQRRYASVEQFSEDIRRHLVGLPVLARGDTFAYRSGKFIRRHAVGVTAALLVLLSLTVGLVVAVRQAQIARRERARAEHRFNDVRDLANSLISGVYDSIEDLPGSTAARKLIVEKALHYLDSLSQESQGDLSLQRELAAAYKRIGDVQGNYTTANLGDSIGSLKSYEKALEIRKAVFAANPSSVSDGIGLAEAERLVAGGLLINNQITEAWKASQKATEIAESLDRTHSGELPLLKELSQDYTVEASILGGNFESSNLGDVNSALEIRKKAVAVDERIFNLFPNDPAAKRGFAVSLTRMGDEYELASQRHVALEYYHRAEKVFEELAVSSPGRRASEALQSIYNRISVANQASGNLPDALVAAKKALAVAEKSSAADPNDIRSRTSLIIDNSNLAGILAQLGQLTAAKTIQTKAIALVEAMAASNPKNGELPGVQASVYATEGDILKLSKEYDGALRYYREMLAIYTKQHSADPDNVDGALQLAAGQKQMAKVFVLKGDLNDAEDMIHKTLALTEPTANAAHPNQEALYTTADSYTGLGEIEEARAKAQKSAKLAAAQFTQARSSYERSLKVWGEIHEPGMLSPGGDDVIPPAVVKQHLADVNRSLKQ